MSKPVQYRAHSILVDFSILHIQQDNDYFLGGLGWSGSPLFNWHPVLMVAGLVTAYTEGPLTIDLSLEYHGTVRTVPICGCCIQPTNRTLALHCTSFKFAQQYLLTQDYRPCFCTLHSPYICRCALVPCSGCMNHLRLRVVELCSLRVPLRSHNNIFNTRTSSLVSR